jgi:hypothetical protein
VVLVLVAGRVDIQVQAVMGRFFRLQVVRGMQPPLVVVVVAVLVISAVVYIQVAVGEVLVCLDKVHLG